MNTASLQSLNRYHSLIIKIIKNYNLYTTLKVKAAEPARTRISDEISFLICRRSCFWCASYFNLIELTIINCSQCHSNRLEQVPISDN